MRAVLFTFFVDEKGAGLVLVYWGLTSQQQPGSYEGGEMMMKSVFWWRKPEYPEETTDLRQVPDETFNTYGLCPVRKRGLRTPLIPNSASSPSNHQLWLASKRYSGWIQLLLFL